MKRKVNSKRKGEFHGIIKRKGKFHRKRKVGKQKKVKIQLTKSQITEITVKSHVQDYGKYTFAILSLLIIIMGSFYLKSEITGLVTLDSGFEQPINLNVFGDTTYALALNNSYDLQRIAISGYVTGTRNVQIFVENDNDWNNIIIAYEPVWAIVNGNTATQEQVENTHQFIRQYLHDQWVSLFLLSLKDKLLIYYGICTILENRFYSQFY